MTRHRPMIVAGVSVMITAISYGFGMYLLPMVLPEMAADLSLDYTRIGTVTAGGQVAVLLSIPVTDILVRRFGALRAIMAVQVTAAILLMGLYQARGFLDFFFFAFLIRAWPVMVWIPLVAVASEHIPFKWRGTFFTVASVASCICVSFDGVFSSFFITHFNWRTMWMAASCISLATGALAFVGLKWSGAWTIKDGERQQAASKSGPELTAWFKSPGAIILNIIFLITGLAFISFQVYLAPYLRQELKAGLEISTMMWSVMGMAGIPSGIAFSIYTDRIGVKWALFLIFVMGTFSAACLFGPPSETIFLAAAALFGSAQAVIYGMGPAYLAKVLPPAAASRAFAVGTAIVNSGGLAGNFLGGWSQDYFGTFQWYYMAAGGVFAAGAMFSLMLAPESKRS